MRNWKIYTVSGRRKPILSLISQIFFSMIYLNEPSVRLMSDSF
jgi:hypothetical protein